jgi:hypothetical protein
MEGSMWMASGLVVAVILALFLSMVAHPPPAVK